MSGKKKESSEMADMSFTEDQLYVFLLISSVKLTVRSAGRRSGVDNLARQVIHGLGHPLVQQPQC